MAAIQAKTLTREALYAAGFVERGISKPDFDPKRALGGAIRSGNVLLVEQLIGAYGIDARQEEAICKAKLNKALYAAVEKADVAAVESLLRQGANPNSAVWDGPSGYWFPASACAYICANSPCYDAERRARFRRIVGILERNGAHVPFQYERRYW